MLVSISEGFCLEGLLAAILLRAAEDMLAVVGSDVDVKDFALLNSRWRCGVGIGLFVWASKHVMTLKISEALVPKQPSRNVTLPPSYNLSYQRRALCNASSRQPCQRLRRPWCADHRSTKRVELPACQTIRHSGCHNGFYPLKKIWSCECNVSHSNVAILSPALHQMACSSSEEAEIRYWN